MHRLGASHQCPLEVGRKLPLPLYADVRLLIPMTHNHARLRKTRHRNILQFYGACTKLPNLCIVTAFCDGDSLYDMIHGSDDTWLAKLTSDVCAVSLSLRFCGFFLGSLFFQKR